MQADQTSRAAEETAAPVAMRVRKRNGALEPVDVNKIVRAAAAALLVLLARPASAALCAADAVDRPAVDAAPAIQKCLDSGETTIALAAGTYYIGATIDLGGRTGVTIATARRSPRGACLKKKSAPCAVLHARDGFDGGPILVSRGASRLRLRYIGINGNGLNRRKAAGAGKFMGAAGYNAQIHDCADCEFVGFASINAVRGTGLEFSGDRAVFDDALFYNNGLGLNRHPELRDGAWADGLTVHRSRGIRITRSEFVDNSDVNLILGSAPGAVIRGNHIGSRTNFAYVALMLDNFNGVQDGDFEGAVVEDNRIDCGPEVQCGIGIMLGPRRWYRSPPIHGAEISGNAIRRVRQGILIDGARGFALFNNRIDMAGGYRLPDGRCRTGYLDVEGKDNDGRIASAVAATKDRLADCGPNDLYEMRPHSFERFIEARDFVARLYGRYLGRAPSASEAAEYASRILNGDATRAQVEAGVEASPEAAARIESGGVPALYERCLGRAAEPAGLAHWNAQPFDVARRGICEEAEERKRFLREEPARALYRQCLGRDASPREAGYWGGRRLPPDRLTEEICRSPEAQARIRM